MAYRKIFGFTEEEYRSLVEPEIQEVIDHFLEQQAHLSKQTIKQYKSSLMVFLKWNHDKNRNKNIFDLKPRDGLTYQNYLLNAGLSTSIVKLRRSTVSSFYGYVEVFWSDEFPNARNIYSKAVPNVGNVKKKDKNPLTTEEIEKITKALTEKEEWQKLAYFWFSIGSGARREEVRQILKEVSEYERHIDAKTGEEKDYYFSNKVRAKGAGEAGKVRTHYITNEAMEFIRKWVNHRKENYSYDDCEYLFVNVNESKKKVTQISAGTFNVWCEEFSQYIDGKKVHPHLLRSTRATLLSNEGVNITAIQKLLGHADPSTTSIYIVGDDDDGMDDIFS